MALLNARTVNSSLDGAKLAYWQCRPAQDTDKTLVLLHGGASNHTRWCEFVAQTSLKRNWNIMVPDVRGNGESMTRKNVNLNSWCIDIADILREEHVGSAVIVGHSLGAHIALQFAASHSDQSQALVLLDPTLQDDLSGRYLWVQRHLWFVRMLKSIVVGLNSIGLRRRSFPFRDLHALDIETRDAIAEADSFDEIAERYSALGPILSAIPVANYLSQAIAMVQPLPSLESIVCPVQVLLSGASTVGDFELNRSQVARFPQADLTILHANHWPLTEEPEETRVAIETWINRLALR